MKSLNFIGRQQFSVLKSKLVSIIPQKQAELADLKKRIGHQSLGTYTVEQVIGGMRAMKGLFQDISSVDPLSGVMMRGYTIPQLKEFLPSAVSQGEPLPEGLFWLLMTGELPNKKEFQSIHDEWNERGKLNNDTINFILSLPRDTHPMTMLSMTVLYEQRHSKFNQVYAAGKANKKNNWEYYLEDSLDLTAKISKIAAVIYRHKYHKGEIIQSDPSLDWAADYAHMLGFNGEAIKECFRGYLSIHADHEGGNVSAHATHLVGSALSDPYLSYSAGLNGLAGPLHGLANQEVLKWVLSFVESAGGDPSKIKEEQIIAYVRKVIDSGNVVPGYGHAVLRETDPRFTHQYEFSKKHIPNEPLIKLLHTCADIVPHTLKSYPKIKNPYPNVDCHSGVLLYALGLKEYEYYTVVFAVSRALGCTSWLVWDRIYNTPIERPGSIDLGWLNHKFRD